MTQTTKTLRLTFVNAQEKKQNLVLSGAREDLSAEQVRTAMSDIASTNVFIKEGLKFYEAPVSAAYIKHDVATIFDDSVSAEDTAAE